MTVACVRRPAFDWDANTTDFLNAYNEGRFVILHRDHGWPDGWAEPTLHSGHVPFFTNGTPQPVVFGINCSSAAFDDPAHPSFVELQIMRPDGGAIAGFGDTRVSPSFPNNHMALGFFDALFPSTVAGCGGPETRRLGDVLIRGKQYMATQEGFEWHGAGDTYVEHYLYHLLGDPTMQMWANPPVRFDPSRFKGFFADYRAIDPTPDPGDPPFFTANCAPNGQLNSQPMTTTGRLTSGQVGIAGAPVKVTYNAPNGQVIERDVVTDSNGNWSDTVQPASLVPNDPNRGDGVWTIQARYAGSDKYDPSQSAPCTVDVEDNF